MQVQILGGRAGSLLPYMLPMIAQARAQDTPVILLVPEQYTLQAERELIRGLQLPGLMDIEVLSPRRLTRKIRELGGHSGLTPLDGGGRSMAIAQALTQEQEHLTYYRRVALTPGLPDKLNVLLADLQRAHLTPEDLRAHAGTMPSGALKAKEADVARIWQAYLDVVDGRFADETMQQQENVRRLIPSGLMTGAAVFVYGFDVLPQPMCELLCETAKVCAGLTVGMTMDAKDAPDGRIFLTQRQSAAELMMLLQTAGISVNWRYLPLRDAPERDPALVHLERTLFTRQTDVYGGDCQAVRLHAAATPYAEAVHAAQTLKAWHDEGIAWQHMAVAMADGNALSGVLAVTLAAAGIPHYLARKDSALRHGLCRMLLGAMRCATGGYGTADVLTMAKSGFSPVTMGEAHQLENYALSHGIDRKKWLSPFTRGAEAEAMEPLRQRLIEPAEALHQRLREAKSAAQSVEAVFRLLEDVHAYEALMARETELLARGMAAEAAANRQVWQLVMDLLDQLHALLGEKRAAMKDVARFVQSGLTGASIASLPPQPDAVIIGEAGHLLTGRIDALILCGMQDGAMGSVQDSLITETERRILSDAMRTPIGLTRLETAALRQSDFYRTIALPQRRLLVSWAQGGQDGTALRPAGMAEDIRSLLPGAEVTGGVTADASEEALLSPQLALDGLALRLRALADGEAEALDPRWEAALCWLWQQPDWHDRLRQVIAGATAQPGSSALPPELTRRLFTQDTVSISRLEKFAGCPYQHFVDYGLKPVQRAEWEFEASDAGEFYHAALQGFAHAALAHPSWPELPDEEIDRLMDEVLAPLTSAWADGPLGDTPARQLTGEKYVRTVKRAAWLFTRQARQSRFVTVGEEVVFGEEGGLPPVVLTLQDGRKIALRGKIDRIDRWTGDEGVYLRVIDYKSGNKKIDPTRIWYGLQLQLLLYLQAAAQGMHGSPAGAFYFKVQDPLVDAQDAREAAEKAIAKELQLKGVVLADVEVVDAMDRDGTALGKIFNKDGSVAGHASAFTQDELDALLAHTQEVSALLADGIRAGEIGVSPAQVKEWSACTYCDYAPVCGMDPTLPHCTKRVLPALDRQELLDRLSKSSSTGEA